MWTNGFFELCEGEVEGVTLESLKDVNPELYYTLENNKNFLEDSYTDEGMAFIDKWNQLDDQGLIKRVRRGEVFFDKTDINSEIHGETLPRRIL